MSPAYKEGRPMPEGLEKNINHQQMADLLQFLLNTPGATPQCLARHQARDKAQLTRKIKALEAQGLIRREADPDDGRKVRLFLSEQGQAMADAAKQIRRAAFAELLQGLSRSEQEQLLGLLQKCQQPLE